MTRTFGAPWRQLHGTARLDGVDEDGRLHRHNGHHFRVAALTCQIRVAGRARARVVERSRRLLAALGLHTPSRFLQPTSHFRFWVFTGDTAQGSLNNHRTGGARKKNAHVSGECRAFASFGHRPMFPFASCTIHSGVFTRGRRC